MPRGVRVSGSRSASSMSASSVRGVAAVVLGVLTASVLAGCSFLPSEEYGPDDRPAVANGIDAEIAAVELRSFLIISTAEDEPGRFLGTIFNNSDEPATVVFADENEEVAITVPDSGVYHFSENQDGFETVGDIPGARLEMTVSVGSEHEEILPIILDGSLDQYRPFLPTGVG